MSSLLTDDLAAHLSRFGGFVTPWDMLTQQSKERYRRQAAVILAVMLAPEHRAELEHLMREE
jgi:hypothetical protein